MENTELDIERLNKEKGHIGESIGYLNRQLAYAENVFARELDANKKDKIKTDINNIKIQLSGLRKRMSEIDHELKSFKHAQTHFAKDEKTNE